MQAAIYVASHSTGKYVSISTIAEKLNISFHYLTKVLQLFTHAGILISYRGPNGGVALARDPSTITLYDLIVAVDGEGIFTSCILGLPGCGSAEPCPAHDSWSEIRNSLETIAKRTTLEELARKAEPLNIRIATIPEGVEI